MRIGLDGIVLHDRKTWTGRLASLFAALADEAPGDRFVVVEQFLRPRADRVRRPNVERTAVRLPRAALAWAWHRGLPLEALTGPVDVYHAFTLYTPRRRSPLVRTAYDLAYLRHPEAFPDEERRGLETAVPRALAEADVVAAISAFTAREVVEALGLPPAKVVAVPLGVDRDLFAPPPPERIAEVRRRHGLDRPYVLSVGTLEPRKNLARLVEAFAALRGFDGDLVLAGAPGWGPPVPEAPRVRRLGRVADRDLPGLYAGAECFAYVSLYEGFGVPVLEALACGSVVVTSGTSSLPEVAGGAAVLVDPRDAASIAAGLERALADSTLRDDLRRRGLERAAELSWSAAARRLLEIYRSLAR